MQPPRVFVSSTFYDLRQVRADLGEFIRSLGYEALLSEYHSFPVDPDADTVLSCHRRVEQDADILVLIIGGRYGNDSHGTKSVTNLEYLAACTKGIPIYAFIETPILSLLPEWEKNKSADFTGSVDNVKLFDFVRQVHTIDLVWVHQFATAQEITAALRTQLAHLVGETLRWRQRIDAGTKDEDLDQLDGEALRIALEKPSCWEYRLFGAALTAEVNGHRELRRAHALGLVLGTGEDVAFNDAGPWMEARTRDLRRLVEGIDPLIREALIDALGPPGEPGSISKIVFVARALGNIYRDCIEWSQRIGRLSVPELFQGVVREMAKFSDDLIERLEEFGPSITSTVLEALAAPSTGEQRVVNIVLKVELPSLDAFNAEMARLQERLDRGA